MAEGPDDFHTSLIVSASAVIPIVVVALIECKLCLHRRIFCFVIVDMKLWIN